MPLSLLQSTSPMKRSTSVLQRRAPRSRMIANPPQSERDGVDSDEDAAAVAKQVAWCLVPRKGISHQASYPS